MGSHYRQVVVVLANLIVGNLILWFFETAGRGQDGVDVRLLGFSAAAVLALWLTFRSIKPGQSFLRSIILSVGVSLVVLVLGLGLSFAPAGPLKAIVLGFVVGPLFFEWAIPMVLLNAWLFQWLSRAPSASARPELP